MLTHKAVEHAKPGRHSDGMHGLALIVKPSGSRSWSVRYRDASGRRREEGLGGWPHVSLAEARRRACQIAADNVPGDAPVITFKDAAAVVLEQNKQVWTGPRTAHEFERRLALHAPRLLDKPVTAIKHSDVLDVLTPLWHSKQKTARVLRGDIKRIMAYAMLVEPSVKANPAGEALDGFLRSQPPSRRHHAAVHFSDMPDVYGRLVEKAPHTAALCVRFLILTACRSGEARGIAWNEINFDTATWTLPAERTKTRQQLRVPLSSEALAVLEASGSGDRRRKGSGLMFRAPRSASGTISPHSLVSILRACEAGGATIHGCRTAFRGWCLHIGADWAASEISLGHSLGSQVVEAYTHNEDLLEARRCLLQQWADHCTGQTGANNHAASR